MPLMPKRVKYRKAHRGDTAGIAHRGNALAFGEFGLQSLGRARLTNVQIEACRVAVNRTIKRRGKIWIRIFPDKSFTKKPLETRMGKGKGNVEGWVALVQPGRMLFELDGVTESLAREAFRIAATKLPMKTRFVRREHHT